MLALVLGVKGVGKSTVLKVLIQQLQLKGVKTEWISYGDVMLDVAKAHGVKDREELSEVPIAQFDKFQLEAAKKIGKMAIGEHVVFLDTHAYIYAQAERILLPGLPDRISEVLKPGLIILMEANPAVIYERRKKDLDTGTRKRVLNTIDEITLNQKAERIACVYLSTKYGVGLKVIDRTKNLEEDDAQIPELSAAVQKALTRQK